MNAEAHESNHKKDTPTPWRFPAVLLSFRFLVGFGGHFTHKLSTFSRGSDNGQSRLVLWTGEILHLSNPGCVIPQRKYQRALVGSLHPPRNLIAGIYVRESNHSLMVSVCVARLADFAPIGRAQTWLRPSGALGELARQRPGARDIFSGPFERQIGRALKNFHLTKASGRR